MGDYAEDRLRSDIRHGLPAPSRPPSRRKLVNCPDCGKPCRGAAGAMQHQNAVHGARHTPAAIDGARNEYEETSDDH